MSITDSKKARLIKGTVVKAVQETSDTWTLFMAVDKNDRNYRAGQFVSIAPQQFSVISDLTRYFEFLKGKKEPIRAYSLASAPFEDLVAITVKLEEYHPAKDALPPLLSPLLASDLLLNKTVEFMGYTGGYILPENASEMADKVVHLVAGSGIVPSFSILKEDLENPENSTLPHVLIYVNKTANDIIYRKEINALAHKFSDRLTVIHYLTREQNPPINDVGQYILSRPTLAHLRELVPDVTRVLMYACGPAITKYQKKEALATGIAPAPRFMEWVQEVVMELGIDKKRIHREVYG